MSKIVIVSFFLLQVLMPQNSQASSSKLSSSKSAGSEKNSFLDPFSATLLYSIRSDFASERKPRKYFHVVALSLSYKLNNLYSILLSSSFSYNSLNEKIITEKGTYGFSDLYLSLSRKINLGKFLSATHSSNLIFESSFPFSEEARLEGYKAIPGASLKINSSFFDTKYNIKNNISYYYIVHSYEYSPSSKVANTRHGFSYSIGHYIKLVRNLTVGFAFGFRYSIDINGNSKYNYNNTQSIVYKLSKFLFKLSYKNGGFTDDGDVDIWYIDRYRRNLKASFVYSF